MRQKLPPQNHHKENLYLFNDCKPLRIHIIPVCHSIVIITEASANESYQHSDSELQALPYESDRRRFFVFVEHEDIHKNHVNQ